MTAQVLDEIMQEVGIRLREQNGKYRPGKSGYDFYDTFDEHISEQSAHGDQ